MQYLEFLTHTNETTDTVSYDDYQSIEYVYMNGIFRTKEEFYEFYRCLSPDRDNRLLTINAMAASLAYVKEDTVKHCTPSKIKTYRLLLDNGVKPVVSYIGAHDENDAIQKTATQIKDIPKLSRYEIMRCDEVPHDTNEVSLAAYIHALEVFNETFT